MNKKIILILFILVNLLLFSSCNGSRGGTIGSEEKRVDERIKQIISAIKDKDRITLKSLFSKKALDETEDFDNGVDYLFKNLQGNFENWERDSWSSDESVENGKKSLMIRCSFDLKTDKDKYRFFLIDYNADTIHPENQGVYMLELIKFTDVKDLESWQDRMRPGLYIH